MLFQYSYIDSFADIEIDYKLPIFFAHENKEEAYQAAFSATTHSILFPKKMVVFYKEKDTESIVTLEIMQEQVKIKKVKTEAMKALPSPANTIEWSKQDQMLNGIIDLETDSVQMDWDFSDAYAYLFQIYKPTYTYEEYGQNGFYFGNTNFYIDAVL